MVLCILSARSLRLLAAVDLPRDIRWRPISVWLTSVASFQPDISITFPHISESGPITGITSDVSTIAHGVLLDVYPGFSHVLDHSKVRQEWGTFIAPVLNTFSRDHAPLIGRLFYMFLTPTPILNYSFWNTQGLC